MSSTTTTTRRAPLQERSQETVARALAAATALLGRGVPLESLTTAQIAHEAGMSVGGLYRFFPDKQAIVDAIALRHMEAFQERMGGALMADFPETPRDFLEAMVDEFVTYLDENPDFRTLAFGTAGGTRQISRIRLAINGQIDRSCQCRFQRAQIAHTALDMRMAGLPIVNFDPSRF